MKEEIPSSLASILLTKERKTPLMEAIGCH